MSADPPPAANRDERPIPVFLHVPKTAGTNLLECIRTNFSSSQILLHYPPENITPPERVPDPRVMAGHLVYGHAEKLGFSRPRYFTFVRDPLRRTVSQVSFAHRYYPRSLPDVEREGVKTAILKRRAWTFDNVMTRQFAGIRKDVPFGELTGRELDLAVARARSGFLFIGEQEQFDRDLACLLNLLGWFNPMPTLRRNVGNYQKFPFSEADLPFLREFNRFDHELYRHIVGEITCHNDRSVPLPYRPMPLQWLSYLRSRARNAFGRIRRRGLSSVAPPGARSHR